MPLISRISSIWLDETKSILWDSEKDGWRHLYQVSLEGKPETLVTNGKWDFTDITFMSTIRKGLCLFYGFARQCHPGVPCTGPGLMVKGTAELVSPAIFKRELIVILSHLHGKYAVHSFSNSFTRPSREFITVRQSETFD
jgi:dipeptidyl-peptidase-4